MNIKLIAVLTLGFTLITGCSRKKSQAAAFPAKPTTVEPAQIAAATPKPDDAKPSAFGPISKPKPQPSVPVARPRVDARQRLSQILSAQSNVTQQSISGAVRAQALADAEAAYAERTRQLKELQAEEDAKALVVAASTYFDAQKTTLSSLVELAKGFLLVKAALEVAEENDGDTDALLRGTLPILAQGARGVKAQVERTVRAERLVAVAAKEVGIEFERTFEENVGPVVELLNKISALGQLVEASNY